MSGAVVLFIIIVIIIIENRFTKMAREAEKDRNDSRANFLKAESELTALGDTCALITDRIGVMEQRILSVEATMSKGFSKIFQKLENMQFVTGRKSGELASSSGGERKRRAGEVVPPAVDGEGDLNLDAEDDEEGDASTTPFPDNNMAR